MYQQMGPQQQPMYIQGQYMAPHPQMMGQQPMQVLPNGQTVVGGGTGPPPFIIGNTTAMATGLPGAPGGGGFPPGVPDVMGVGKTRGEMMAELCQAAQNNQADEPQDFKPADDDPSRMYWCREADGDWVQRNRFAIDRLEGCRWFIDERGRFYVVRSAE